ncbi:MAG: ABC transporter permease [Spirochaetaceae bacterium]|nr:MAG: ABC transporter permease [Spirochaetaceae bacterium]
MRQRFISFMGFRYFRSRRRGVGGTSTALSILGVAVGVMALTAVTGVMNGFQLGFIESILEISSYHLQIRGLSDVGLSRPGLSQPGLAQPGLAQPESSRFLESLRSLPEVRSAVPFSEHQVIVEGRFSDPRGCLIRGLPEEIERLDPSFFQALEVVDGDFDLQQPGTIVLGVELSRHLGVGVGDGVSVLSLEGSSLGELKPASRFYEVVGLFRSGYYEFDLGWAFFSLREGLSLDPDSGDSVTIGVKIQNRFRDQQVMRDILRMRGVEGVHVASWREFNRAFFGALRMEKIMMTVLIGLIFIVVGFNIHHGLRRAVRERYEEIGVLKALGASDTAVRRIFILEGLLIGTIGSILGLLLGLLISVHINAVFTLAEWAVNAGLAFADLLLYPLLQSSSGRFSLFSPAYFYITEVPSTVLLREAVLIVLFAVLAPTVAAAAAAAKVKDVRPAEVLRYE